MSEQPEALRLADMFEAGNCGYPSRAAAELRRLHEVNQELLEALKLALRTLEYIHEGANNQGPHTGISWRCVSNKAEPAITTISVAIAKGEQA